MKVVPQMHLQRPLTFLAWGAVIGLAAVSSNYPAALSMPPQGSTWASALPVLHISLVAMLWLAVIVAGVSGIRRWSLDPTYVRIETTVLVLASLALTHKAALVVVAKNDPWGLLGITHLPLIVPEMSGLTSAFCVAALLATLLKAEQPIGFEALVAPTVAFIFPFALTGVWSGASTAISVTFWATAASAVVLGFTFFLTRDEVQIALLAGASVLIVMFMPIVGLCAVLLATVALFLPHKRPRAQLAFAVGADRIALLGAGLGLVVCFSGALLIMMSPTLRSQMERADLALAMRSLPTILGACATMFVLCALTSPLVAFSLLTATMFVPIVGTWAFETQCSIIGGGVPLAIAATLVRAEWQRSGEDARRRRFNLLAAAVLFVVGCAGAMIPHPPFFNV